MARNDDQTGPRSLKMVTLAMLANLEARFERMVTRASELPEGQTNDATLRVMSELGALLSQLDRVDAAIDDVRRPPRKDESAKDAPIVEDRF